ncbi:MAG: hypothetical protein PUF61_04250 [Spirochaetales bacterium]|nr:hypothetical protein [Spirochaetales bacterium]
MNEKQKGLFKDLLAEASNTECQRSIRRLRSALNLFDQYYPCIDEKLFSKIVRNIMTIRTYLPESKNLKELSKIQGHYHHLMNQQHFALDDFFKVDDFGFYSDEY